MRETWTFPEILPPCPPRVKLPWPADVLANCGPAMNPPEKKKRRPPRRVPRTKTQGWQHPRRVGYQRHSPKAFSMPLRNRFDGLPISELAREPAQLPRGSSLHEALSLHVRPATVVSYQPLDLQREMCLLSGCSHSRYGHSLMATAISYPAK